MDAETRVIELTRGKVTIVDAEDYEFLSQNKWYALRGPNTWYAVREVRTPEGKRTSEYMHRVIADAPARLSVDHVNSDGLDNRRSNLRLATHAQNCRNQRRPRTNKSGFKGVYWHKKAKRWNAQIKAGQTRFHLGLFDTPEEAHAAYCEASKKYHGEWGRTG